MDIYGDGKYLIYENVYKVWMQRIIVGCINENFNLTSVGDYVL